MELRHFEPGTLPEDVQRAACALERAAALELWPPELVGPLEHEVVQASNWPTFWHVHTIVAGDLDASLAGAARCYWYDQESNRDHFEVEITVTPERRRQGLGRQLLEAAIGQGRERYGTRIVDIGTTDRGPGPAFLTAVGAEKRYSGAHNICETASLDREMLEEWVRRSKERASDYSLIAFDGPVPAELEEPYVELNAVMNTAPHEDLDEDDDVFSVEHLRDHDAAWVAQQNDVWTVIARHDPTGELAGYTRLRLPKLWPSHSFQEDTAVMPTHRDRGLGRWLKAVNALRLLDERPDVERIETENAGSNEPMLGINHAMGFASAGAEDWWQLELR